MDAKDLISACTTALDRAWAEIVARGSAGMLLDALSDSGLRGAISRSINSGTVTYRYVLPAQLLAKLVDPSLDCRSVQVAAGVPGAFDARSLCHKVIVPFDHDHHGVLGNSPEPYVNNPLRVPAVTLGNIAQQKNKEGWRDLCVVLETVQTRNDVTYTGDIFTQVLIELYRRLATVQVTYPVPIRINLDQCVELVSRYLSAVSGGDRAQAIASALFRAIGESFHLYGEVRRGRTTAADVASGQVADLECVTGDGEIVMAVEVKDRPLALAQVQDKIPNMRPQKVREFLFLALRGIQSGDAERIASLVRAEYASGLNIYIFDDFPSLSRATLAFLGEDGRRQFLEFVGQELEAYSSDITHRRAWATLLSQV